MTLLQRPALTILLVIVPLLADAALVVRTNEYTIGDGAVVSGQVFVATDKGQIEGTLEDDLFIFANELKLDGIFKNDAWAIGNTIEARGAFGDHLRLLANTVTIEGSVTRGITAAGNSVRLATNSTVGGTLDVVASTAVLEGHVTGNARVMAESITLSGNFGGNVRIIGNDIVILPHTVIAGNIVYTADKELVLDSGVTVGGEVIRQTVTATPVEPDPDAWKDTLILQAFLLLAAVLVGMPFLAVFPRYAERSVLLLRVSPLKCMATGVIALFMLPTFAVFSFATLIGIPLGLIVGLFFLILAYLAKIVIGLTLGGSVLRLRGSQGFGTSVFALITGLFLLYVLTMLPLVGGAASLAIVILGAGALVLSLMMGQREKDVPPALPPSQDNNPRSSDTALV